jgi:hypothetical protein
MRRPTVRHLLRACALLLAGAAVTMVVAWGCALWGPMPGGAFSEHAGAQWPSRVPASWAPRVPRYDLEVGNRVFHLRGAATSTSPGPGGRIAYVWETGWPWPAVRAAQFEDYSAGGMGARSSSGALTFDMRVAGWLRTHNDAVPLRPVGWAFVGDTLVYACVVGGLLTCAVWMRERMRRRRGLCIGCGYDRAGIGVGSACPECGRAGYA